MEEAVIEDKKKGEEKRKSTYTVGELSRLTKRGTDRSFLQEVGTFCVVVLVFEEVAGQHLVDQWVSIEVRLIAVHLLHLLLDQAGELDRVIAGGNFYSKLFYLWETAFGTMLGTRCHTQDLL
ncbi:UNVERIFIED_CONTAM: hypothetical protein Sradi_4863900 [Sesamum radiatum]|uniref:Uncharacterized protein n=1 Tax=Sesamum radiatum TaxID=300843 RepID=A0AAW2N0X6_SESRA